MTELQLISADSHVNEPGVRNNAAKLYGLG